MAKLVEDKIAVFSDLQWEMFLDDFPAIIGIGLFGNPEFHHALFKMPRRIADVYSRLFLVTCQHPHLGGKKQHFTREKKKKL